MIRIDVRGMRCPWPAVRLARALRDGARIVTVVADDPRAPIELAAVADTANATIDVISDAIFPTFLVTCR